ncbi:MAG: hypothetical protein ACRECX_04350 [Methyloceanibacter sp.]|uniref:hypothetical protein n=1 Tax=Methyloceanibacter sp. TaxID=1965321 RepID=UPI003D6D26F2
MRHGIRYGALALGLVAGAALMAPPAMANSVHKEGYFGGSWDRIGPHSRYYDRRHAGRVGPLYSKRYYRGPGYSAPRGYAYYGPRHGYYGAPYYYDRGPSVSFGVGVF